MVPEEGVEPSWCCHRWILSPVRLPFRHPGKEVFHIFRNINRRRLYHTRLNFAKRSCIISSA